MRKDLLSVKDLSLKEIKDIFTLTKELKKYPGKFKAILSGKTLALIFEKPSNRTYVSFSVGMYQLGGNSVYLGPEQIKLRVRETIGDVANTLARYVDGIVLRTFEHQNILDMAKAASVPVINGLSDFSHPCQALADVYTISEKLKNKKDITLAYIGDGNNVCNSLLYACAKTGINMNVATPKGYEPDSGVFRGSQSLAKQQDKEIKLFHNPQEAVKYADVLYTDVWASMGQEKEARLRKKIFSGFQIDNSLVKRAKKGVLIMHCLPAHRGEEITASVIDSPNSIVFDQAENRMHVQKAILIKLMGNKK
ncbi:MAG: ornithine carbamoyltransferase [bacterium]